MPSTNIVFSEVCLGLNAYKSILFRAASLLLEFTVYNLFIYIAFRRRTFTSYLMFAEVLVQKLLFVFAPSPRARRGRVLLFAFIVFITAAAFYDTMLWALDSPGYVLLASTVPASTVNDKLRTDMDYVVHTKGTPGDVADLDLQLELSEGLWQPGTNATLTGKVSVGSGVVVPGGNFSADEEFPGPRIWLDSDGFSVALEYGPAWNTEGDCQESFDRVRALTWNCSYGYYGNSKGHRFLERRFGQPYVWWDTELGAGRWTAGVRGGNPWWELGSQTETLVMKEIWTITKGRTRHVFLISAFKATMVSQNTTELKAYDIEDLTRRTWTENDAVRSQQDDVIATILAAKHNDTGLTMGWVTSDDGGHTINAKKYQYTKPATIGDDFGTFFQVQISSLKLLRSETIPTETVPVETCDGYYFVGHAAGGKARYTTCNYDARIGAQNTRYLGQMDISSLYILADTLGKTSANNSARVLNETAWKWFQEHEEDMEKYVISRGYLLGINASAVTIDIHTNIPTVSVLQLLLVFLPLVLALLSWLLVFFSVPAYYKASLFSIIAVVSQDKGGTRKPGYMLDPPDIEVVEEERQVLLRMPTGALLNGGDSLRGKGGSGNREDLYNYEGWMNPN